MNWSHVLFGFQDRINRAKYWLAALVYFVTMIVLSAIGYFILTDQGMIYQIVYGVVSIAIFISGLAVGIKRLHDRNKSGWYLLIFYLVPGLLFGAGTVLGLVGIDNDSGATSVVAIAINVLGFAVAIWAFIELGCLRGTIGGNRYGGDPLAPQPAPPRTIVR